MSSSTTEKTAEIINMDEYQEVGAYDLKDLQKLQAGSNSNEPLKQEDLTEETKEELLSKYKQSAEEIKRRKEYIQEQSNNESEEAAIQDYSSLLQLNQDHGLLSHCGYKFAIINIAHRLMNPISKKPAFRILGFFRDQKDLIQYLQEAQKYPGIINPDGTSNLGTIHKVPLIEKFCLLTKSEERNRSESYVLTKTNEIKKLHMEFFMKSREEFQTNIKETKTGAANKSLEKKREKAKKLKQKSSREAALNQKMKSDLQNAIKRSGTNSNSGTTSTKNSKQSANKNIPLMNQLMSNTMVSTCSDKDEESEENNLDESEEDNFTVQSNNVNISCISVPGALQRRRQNFVVILVLEDITKPVMQGHDDPEPLILFIDCFEDETSARNYMSDVLSKYVYYHNMFLVEMYEWLFPEDLVYDKMDERYRDEEQNKIMQAKKEKEKELKDFEKEHNIKPDTTQIAAALTNEQEGKPIISGAADMKVKVLEPISKEELYSKTDMKNEPANRTVYEQMHGNAPPAVIPTKTTATSTSTKKGKSKK